MLNKTEQQSILDALELSGVNYSDIQFYGNNRVVLYQEIEDQEILFLAECGIFTPLKQDAILIWDTLGVSRDFGNEDIDFFIVWIDGKAYAKFVIFPDLERTAYNAITHEQPQTNWDVDRAELLLEIGIEVEEIEASLIEFNEIIMVAVKLHFTGRNEKQAARMFTVDLLELIRVQDEKTDVKRETTDTFKLKTESTVLAYRVSVSY